MKTIDFYKKAITAGKQARSEITKIKQAYDAACRDLREELQTDSITEKAFNEQMSKFNAELSERIEKEQQKILDIAAEFEKESKEAARLDGNQIDDSLLHILNSGLKLSREDWETLGETYKDNWTACRLLQERYDADPCYTDSYNGMIDGVAKEKIYLKFGADPMKRAETFSRFASIISNSAKSGTAGSQVDNFKDQDSYWNDLARKSIRDIKPTGNDDFSDIDSQFPVEYGQNSLMGQVW